VFRLLYIKPFSWLAHRSTQIILLFQNWHYSLAKIFCVKKRRCIFVHHSWRCPNVKAETHRSYVIRKCARSCYTNIIFTLREIFFTKTHLVLAEYFPLLSSLKSWPNQFVPLYVWILPTKNKICIFFRQVYLEGFEWSEKMCLPKWVIPHRNSNRCKFLDSFRKLSLPVLTSSF
jgi:hypothetical protein